MEESKFLLDRDEEEDKEIDIGYKENYKIDNNYDFFKRPRLFILPNYEKLKEIIEEVVIKK